MTATARHGTVETRDGLTVIRFQRQLAHPVERVWQALTQPRELRAWLAAAEVDLREGGTVRLRWLNTESADDEALMTATITRLDPPHLIEYRGEMHGTLRWELRPEGSRSVLIFSSTLRALEGEMGHMVPSGWHIHLDFLEEALDGRSVDWPHWPRDRWERVDEDYAQRLSRA